MGETEILVLGHHLSREYVESVTASTTIANARVLLDILRHPGAYADPGPAMATVTADPHLLFELASLRRESSVDGEYLAQPNVFSYHRQQAAGSSGALVAIESCDIVVNAVAVDSHAVDPFAARLEQGVLDTNIEALVSGVACELSGQMVCPRVYNAAELLDEAIRQGTGWRVLTSGSDVADMEATAEVEAAWHQALADGYLVVVPARPFQG